MLIPEVHGLGARVLVQQEGLAPYESYVTYIVGDGTQLDRNAEWYRVADERCPQEGLPAQNVRRILQVNMPRGDTFEGICSAVVRDGVSDDPNAPITMYIVRYLHAPTVHEYAYPDWITPL